MINYNDNNIYESTFHQANNFIRLVENCSFDKNDKYNMNPLYINMLLACELFLKSVLIKNGYNVNQLKKYGHNLKTLYNELPANIQNDIKDFMKNFNQIDVFDFLDNIREDFVNCRYMFINNTNNSYDFDNVKDFMYKLQHIVSLDLYGKDTYKEIN